MQSRPRAVFVQDAGFFWPIKINSYGAAAYLGNCVVLGPNGHNVDVVAHELMHQELRARIGLWRMWRKVPVWFDEGVAMQVDMRPRYALTPAQQAASGIDSVKPMRSVGQFNQGDDAQITQHYAFAKAVVARWLANAGGPGSGALYPNLDRIRAGESFETVTGL